MCYYYLFIYCLFVRIICPRRHRLAQAVFAFYRCFDTPHYSRQAVRSPAHLLFRAQEKVKKSVANAQLSRSWAAVAARITTESKRSRSRSEGPEREPISYTCQGASEANVRYIPLALSFTLVQHGLARTLAPPTRKRRVLWFQQAKVYDGIKVLWMIGERAEVRGKKMKA